MITRIASEVDRYLVVQMMAKALRIAPEALTGDTPFELIAVINDRTGAVVGAVLYNCFADGDIRMTAAGVPGWLTRTTLKTIFGYPFNELQCRRVTAVVHRKNKRSRKLCEGLGYKQEGVIRKCFSSGDGILYGMLKSECRWIKET